MKSTLFLSGRIFALAIISLPAFSSAATLLATSGTAPVAPATDLTAVGSTNWAAWDYRTNAASTSFSPTTVKTGGIGTISAITATNVANVRGHSNMDSYFATGVFTFSDGTGLASNSDKLIGGIFNSGLDQTTNGAQFTIGSLAPLTGGLVYQINVYASAFRGTATVLATLGTSVSQAGNPNASPTDQSPDLFQFFYNPDSIDDNLVISTLLSSNTPTTDSSHASILAVAISVVPEPSSAMLLLLGASAGLLGGRRRW